MSMVSISFLLLRADPRISERVNQPTFMEWIPWMMEAPKLMRNGESFLVVRSTEFSASTILNRPFRESTGMKSNLESIDVEAVDPLCSQLLRNMIRVQVGPLFMNQPTTVQSKPRRTIRFL
ncbi:uncharacterized protein METZ01_LOCUS14652 [marine metagenome]|uniref:Uncharacterized protein n=1 Tax=marine metagenome TaxID=408172 RepID=A0A381P6F8_9ZZZZ